MGAWVFQQLNLSCSTEAQEATEVYRSGRCIPPVYRSLAAESATGEGMVIAKSLPIPTPAMQERITMERTNEVCLGWLCAKVNSWH